MWIEGWQAAELAHRLGALATLAEVLGSVLTSHMATPNCRQLQF